MPSTFAGVKFTVRMSLSKHRFVPLRDEFLKTSADSSAPGRHALSKPASNFYSQASSILLDGVFRVFRAARIEVLLVQNIEDTARHVQVFSDRVARQCLVAAQPSAPVSTVSNSCIALLATLQKPQHSDTRQHWPHRLHRLNGRFSLPAVRPEGEWWNALDRDRTPRYMTIRAPRQARGGLIALLRVRKGGAVRALYQNRHAIFA